MIYIFFLFLEEKIYCEYSLEVPHRGTSNEYAQHKFSSRNKKKMPIFGQVNFVWTSGFRPFTCPWTSNEI